ncbi:MAG TPA: M1 family aminopeptidase [Pyrinomonadaceae bacterium]|nr:M1 family aminopeptidase [Pyrinomonadaceae bacterium]
MPQQRRVFLLMPFILAWFLPVFGQDQPKPITAEVTVNATDSNYTALRGDSSGPDAFSGDYATVNNLVLKKDAGIFILKTGEIYFLKPVQGKSVGAVFIGNGEFQLTPPTDVEKKSLAIFTDSSDIKEPFDGLTLFFTDDTLNEVKNSPNAKMASGGPQADKARSMFRDKEDVLRKTFHFNMTSRTLADIYAPQRKGFFYAFIDGNKFGKLVYQVDPVGLPEVYPEQVELSSYGETSGGIWTAFHLADEYKKGTANSWQDRRSYDIKNHNMDVTVNGTRLTVTDEITLQMREANARFLPFDLYKTLRVRAVKDESGSALVYIQEKKDEDADFGVILPEPKEVGKPFKIKVEYDGIDALREAGTGNFILIPRSTWYPNNPNTAFGDRATFDLTFHYPKKYVMVGVGSRVGDETTDGDLKTSKWSSEGVELAVAGFNYGDFKEKTIQDPTTGLGLEVYANRILPNEIKGFQQQVEQAESAGAVTGMTIGSLNTASMSDTVLNQAQNATRIYNSFYGKLPYKRVAMTQQPAGFFGQAWPTLVFMPYTAFFDDTYRVQLFGMRGGTDTFWTEVAPHEVAHQWFGHIVGWTSYHDQWMSEGFAEFSTSLYVQYVKKDIAKFIQFWEDHRKQIIEGNPATKGRKPYTVGPVTQGYRLNNARTGSIARYMIYPKGAFILHMLRMMMYDARGGTRDERFQKMMQDFLTAHYNSDISTEDFKKAVEAHMLPLMNVDKSGKMDWFFDEWVYGTEMPSYKLAYSLTSGESGKTILNGKLTQSGVSDNFVMVVPLYADAGNGWVHLGSATLVGNTTVDLSNIALPATVKKIAVAALDDVLAEKIENVKQ